ncbi:centrosomal protein POC5 isoform X2 [Nerophis lumbriciformis]|uniref:centrosomal protein POC5 isoform X2 n=1 Tax=Nerophis lumbriciformis TaxID=546530 RepID=UPI002ADFE40A|nr:centrosomal protein POC5-like isoform X2 [Nerophis lumbriciformis]
MSSDEEPSVPILPKDSTYRSNSVSSQFQDEYEELLQNTVVSPRFEPVSNTRVHGRSASHLSIEGRNSQRNSQQVGERLRHDSRGIESPDRIQDASDRSQSNIKGILEFTEIELFISEENIGKIEIILDTWSTKLKSNILRELRKWRVAFIDQHKRELQKEREIHNAQKEALKLELDSLKDLLNTYEISNKRKDEVIKSLTLVLDRQNDKLDKMKAFTHWKIQFIEAKEAAHAVKLAQQHHCMYLKRKMWLAWRAVAKKEWKIRVEQACRERAEDVCTRLAEEYEAKLNMLTLEHNEEREKMLAEIQRLQVDRERREVSMRKALMRGVCALNMETLQLFNAGDAESEENNEHDADSSPDDDPDHDPSPDPDPDPGPGPLAQAPQRPGPGPAHFDRSKSPAHHDKDQMGPSAPMPGPELPTSTLHTPAQHPVAPHAPAAQSLFPQGGSTVFHKPSVPTAVQQKTPNVATARVTAKHASSKSIRNNVEAMAVAPPMSSVAVDHHQSVSQQTMGQATAAKYPRSSQHASRATGGRTHARTHIGTYPGSASPVDHFNHPDSPTHPEEEDIMGMWRTREFLPSASHSLFPQGGSSMSHKQASGRVVTSSQQKAAKTITARITAQHVPDKSARSNLRVMGVAPSMCSIVVERHQPTTQFIGGQSPAARYPRSSQPGPRTPKTSSKAHPGTCNVHSIKVVD